MRLRSVRFDSELHGRVRAACLFCTREPAKPGPGQGIDVGEKQGVKDERRRGAVDEEIGPFDGGADRTGENNSRPGRRQPELDAAVKEIGPKAVAVRADSSDIADLAHLFDKVKAAKGRIDVLFANAGVYEFTPFGTITEGAYDKMFDINVKGVLFTVQQAAPLMADGGSIILTGSVAGSKGFEAGTVYSATKAAIRSFARSWTFELKGRHIRVNVLSPGPIQTPGLDVFANDDVKNLLKSLVPLGRLGTADEVAKTALFLASDDSSFAAGIELFVDGAAAI